MCPIFEWECVCGRVVEVISSEPVQLHCERCGKPLQRKVSGMAKTPGAWQ